MILNLNKEKLWGGFDPQERYTIWVSDGEKVTEKYANKVAEVYCEAMKYTFKTDNWKVVNNGLTADMIIELHNPTIDDKYRVEMWLNKIRTYPEKQNEFELNVFENYGGYALASLKAVKRDKSITK